MTVTLPQDNSNGTSLSIAQDASRLNDNIVPPPAPRYLSPTSTSDSRGGGDEQKSWKSSDDTLEGAMSTDDLPEKLCCTQEEPEPGRDERPSPKRPTVCPRQATTASVAAAPYIPFCCDVERPPDHVPSGMPQLRRSTSSSSSSSSAPTLQAIPSNLANASRVSTDAYGNTYPEGWPFRRLRSVQRVLTILGGREAWLCVLGSFCGLMSALG